MQKYHRIFRDLNLSEAQKKMPLMVVMRSHYQDCEAQKAAVFFPRLRMSESWSFFPRLAVILLLIYFHCLREQRNA